MYFSLDNAFRKIFIFAFGLCITALFLYFFSSSFYSFFDYENYNMYIETGRYYPRFIREPVSMYAMHLTSSFGFTAYFYYCLSVVFLFFCFVLLSANILKNDNLFLILVFIVFLTYNPLTMIFLQTPRNTLSFSFFVLSFIFALKEKYTAVLFFLLLSVLSHTVTGFLSVFFVILYFLRPLFQFILVLLGLIIFYFFLSGYFPGFENFEAYDTNSYDRGRGRFFLGVFVFFLFYSLFSGASKLRLYALQVFIFGIIAFILTPYAHRILYFSFFVVSLYFFMNVNSVIFKSFSFLFSCVFVLFSFYIMENSLYGY